FSVEPDCIYLNSMFSLSFTLLPLEACNKNFFKTRVVLAPRGMLHVGALQYKRIKKKVFFRIFKLRGFQKKLLFHATDQTEEADIKKIFGRKVAIAAVKDFPTVKQDALKFLIKNPGTLKCLFISRICPTKNLYFLLTTLKQVTGRVFLTIAGPVEDEKYWDKCTSLIAGMPGNITVQYIGPLANQLLPDIYRQHHLFFLPTFGENFGHVIFDALLNGRPVVISDNTPWKGLPEKGIGWDISLNETQSFGNAIEQAVGWTQEVFDSFCTKSWTFAKTYLNGSDLRTEYIKLFN
ncbi:MAG: glycosyltransferase, partial [Chitinophagaceae bacterium]